MNAVTVTDAFPLPFTDNILDAVVRHDMYSFLDGFSGYNQVHMHPEDQEKTTVITDWGVYVTVVMMFGLKTTPATFQRTITEIFGEYIPAFMQVFLKNFALYDRQIEHLRHLCMCPASSAKPKPSQMHFYLCSGVLLDHLVSRDGIAMETNKVHAILNTPAPTTTKALN